jgi:hypothetical protein
MTITYDKQVLIKRGNTASVSTYVGPLGELVLDTDTNLVYVHDGVTVGGAAVSGESAADILALESNVTALQSDVSALESAGFATEDYVDNAVGNIVIPEVNLTGYATESYVSTQINNLVGGAPALLDTLNEIAAAINDDANIAVTLTDTISNANIAMKGYVDSQSFYSNAKVASYLPTYSGNIAGNISKNGYAWTFGTDGTLTFPDDSIQTVAYAGGQGRAMMIDTNRTDSYTEIGSADRPFKTFAAAIAAAEASDVTAYTFILMGCTVTEDVDFGGTAFTQITISTPCRSVITGNVTINNNSDLSQLVVRNIEVGGTFTLAGDGTTNQMNNCSFYNVSFSGIVNITATNATAFYAAAFFGAVNFTNLSYLYISGAQFNTDWTITADSTGVIPSKGITPGTGGSIAIVFSVIANNVIFVKGGTATYVFQPHMSRMGLGAGTYTIPAGWTFTPHSSVLRGTWVNNGSASFRNTSHDNAIGGTAPTYVGTIGAANVKFQDGTTQTTAWTGTGSYGNVQVATYLQHGNIANVSVAGNISASGSVSGNFFIGDGSQLTGITANTANITSNVITFNTAAGINVAAGQMAWNSADGTLNIGLSYADVVLQVGQETHYVVRNDTGNIIQNGTAVYCSGVAGGSGRIEASPMMGNIDPVQFLGLATQDINNGVNGVVTYFGYVRGLDTRGTANTAISVGDETWAVGDKLYVHPTAAGKLTNVEPEAPNVKICVASIMIRNQTAGVMFVRPTSNLDMTDLSDVQITSPASDQILLYDNNRWENVNFGIDIDTTPTLGGNLAGAGFNVSNVSTISATGNISGGNLISSATIYGNVDVILGNTANAAATKTRIVTDTAFSYIQTGNGTVGSTGNIVFSPYLSTTQRVVIDTASGNLTASGNVTARHFIGDGSTLSNVTINIAGNIVGTQPNVTLVSGSYDWTFDNTGNLTLPGNTFAVNYADNTPVDIITRFEGSWSVPTGNTTQSFTVDPNNTYQLWVDCNIPNGILTWNATATITNTNVPVIGAQYAWVYTGGGTPIDFTSIPNQFVGTANVIVRSSGAPSATTNRFDFGINNASGNVQIVRYGWIKIS